MSCLGPNYNPIPPREWYRYKPACINQLQNPGVADAYTLAVLYKGNILQYKKNSASITKNQRYSQIARGAWTNRTTTWASQTQTYTNPNTKSLKRVNYTGALGENSIYDPRICPPIIPTPSYSALPPSGESLPPAPVEPVLPPLPPPPVGPAGPILPPLIDPAINPDLVIPDGGTLLCNTVEIFCTGEVVTQYVQVFCNPTSDSDVPGPIIDLCYNNGLPTYYPKTKLTYGTSDSKWPVNSKFIFPAN